MSYITPAQAAMQQRVAAQTFTDTALRKVAASVNGDYGTGTGKPTYTDGATFACSFQGKPVKDAQAQSAVPMDDADLYYPLGTILDPADRVTITHLYGVAVNNPQTYEIVGGPFLRHNLMHAELRLATEG